MTLTDTLAGRALARPDDTAYLFLGEEGSVSITWRHLHQAAQQLAAQLVQQAGRGERVALFYPPGIDYIVGVVACLMAGVVAVPCYPPTNRRHADRVLKILQDCAPKLILVPQGAAPRLQALVGGYRFLEAGFDDAAAQGGGGVVLPPPALDELALLQYTSGSTGEPKGVMLTQRNLVRNTARVHVAFRFSQCSVFVTWLPPYHDMGLIGGLLQVIHSGCRGIVLAPTRFLQQPVRWLQIISDHRATHSGAPNFAYELCARRITAAQKEGLDLSSWEVAFCGAEPIRADTLARFHEVFKHHGFRRGSFLPCYGLAEATLMVSAARRGQGAVTARCVASPGKLRVSSGIAAAEHVAVVDPLTHARLAPGRVGEIWVAGDTVASGYWGRSQATQETFGARIAGEGGVFLRTGDTGFLQHGELFVTGRLKDVIVLHGRNIHPQDVESASFHSHAGLRVDGAAAFAAEGEHGERLVVVQELEFRQDASAGLFGAIATAVADAVGTPPDVIALVKAGAIARTSSGKVRRRACREALENGTLAVLARWERPCGESGVHDDAAGSLAGAVRVSAQEIEAWLCARLDGRSHSGSACQANGEQTFASMGVDSIDAVAIAGVLGEWLRRPVLPTSLWDHPTPARLARYLAGEVTESPTAQNAAQAPSDVDECEPRDAPALLRDGGAPEPIAIIGMGCRFPGADTPEAFWHLLREGVDAVQMTPRAREAARTFENAHPHQPHLRWGGFLEQVDEFDAPFFAIAPHEAMHIDPQHRLVMEVAWEALEDAALAPAQLAGTAAGVFIGLSTRDYDRLRAQADSEQASVYAATGSAASIAANRLSYLLDVHGPSIVVDTACSSSLVAVHLACQSLRQGEASVALAGGVNLMLSTHTSLPFAQAGMLAADGRCKSFDAAANGYVRAEGCGMVVLKRWCDAQRDGDPVHALILGSAVHHGGRSNGLVAPNGTAQQAVIRRALANARVAPRQISLVEAHGTGTALGDPIELNALKAILLRDRPAQARCAIGSVKTNIGHAEAAAGAAGLMKVALALQHGAIPPHLHYRAPNPHGSVEGTPFTIATRLQAWEFDGGARHAGVSSFGFGGTLAHVVVAQAPEAPRSGSPWPCTLITLSAKTPAALDRVTDALAAALQARPELPLADVAYTHQAGRNAMRVRRMVVCRDRREAIDALTRRDAPVCATAVAAPEPAPVAFAFAHGVVRAGASRDLYEHLPVFREHVDACAAILQQHAGWDVREALYPAGGTTPSLDAIDRAGPAAFVVAYALARTWMQWGFQPAALSGQGVGAHVAACVSGALSLADGLAASAEPCDAQPFRHGGGVVSHTVLDIDPGQADLAGVLHTLGRLWLQGHAVPWNEVYAGTQPRRLHLPTTPFERERHWIDQAMSPMTPASEQRSEVLATLQTLVAELLRTTPERVDPAAPLLELGADSIVLVQVLRKVEVRFGVTLTIRQLFEETKTLRQVAAYIEARSSSGASVQAPKLRPEPIAEPRKPYVPYQSPRASAQADPLHTLTPRQREHLTHFTQRYTQRTAGSKAWAQRHRATLADNRAAAGFRFSVKEMLYPLVSQRSEGARLWDVDGNEYIDLTMGFGVHLFGHRPAFIEQALAQQLQQSIALGPQAALAGEVAQAVCAMTGMERVTFCNSGTEAVMLALRLTKAVTGRRKVAMFAGSYHGWSDDTLAVPDPAGQAGGVAMAPGISAEHTLVLEYGSPQALETLRAHAHELAAVLVEPVQSRRPDLQPGEFLQALRTLTREHGVALVFDEVITGFRLHPGGAQAWFGVRADLAVYGKVVGGGMPLGLVAGAARYLDAVDGGAWQYGDGSYPQAATTFFAGTFCKHPLALAAAHAVLQRLRDEGPALQERLNERTAQLAARLNRLFTDAGLPLRAVHCGSLFRIDAASNVDLLFLHAAFHGLYVWEGRNMFLSTAHTQDEVDRVVQAFAAGIRELQDGGFFPAARTPAKAREKALQFSLSFFGLYAGGYEPSKYELLLQSARFADGHGFTALWLPERHFHAFGGLSPNPAVLAAALARETQRIQLRAGSVVLPLHQPIRVAEEWAMVDNLSNGRTGIAFGCGWHPADFVLAPQAFCNRRESTFQNIAQVQALWRGQPLRATDGAGRERDVSLFPLPRQAELPTWITVVDNPQTWERAGALGAGILTNLMGQTVEDLARNVALYRAAFERHGHDPSRAHVTVLLHTFVAESDEQARELARRPFIDYLRSSLGLFQSMARSLGLDADIDALTEADREHWLSVAYQRYVDSRALIGSPSSCAQVAARLHAIGVDEIGCFVDFGVAADTVTAHLPWLDRLRAQLQAKPDEPAAYPLTLTQQGILFECQLNEQATLRYNTRTVLRLRGPLNAEALQQALDRVLARHPALRSVIDASGDTQHVRPAGSADLERVDLSADASPASAARQWLAENAGRAFDLVHGPLARLHLLQLGAQEHWLVLCAHHIVTDGASQAVLVQEIAACYRALCQGGTAQLKPALPFSDHVAQEQAYLHSERFREDGTHWLGQFADTPPPLDLPADRPHGHATGRAAQHSLSITGELHRQLQRLGAARGCTLFATLLAAFTTLLHRLSRQEDLTVGVPMAVRQAEPLVGCTLNVVALRCRPRRTQAFTEHLAQVQRSLLDAAAHNAYPFGALVRQLKLPRDAQRRPLASVLFNMDRLADLPDFGADVHGDLVPTPQHAMQEDLIVDVTPWPDRLEFNLNYRQDLFDDATIARWANHFLVLLGGIVAHPEASLGELPLLDAQELHRMLVEWNATQAPLPDVQCLHGLVEAQARATPQATAVVFEAQTYSYAELNARANQLAHHLRERGVGPDVLVGVHAERSLDLVVGLLGVLKAGGAYVPLDPDHPAERLARIAADLAEANAALAAPTLLLTQAALAARLPADAGTPIRLDADAHFWQHGPTDNPAGGALPHHAAYAIYTSGSTGQPKGVVNTHRGIVNRLCWMQHAYALTGVDRVLQKTPLSFDVSVWELFWPLLAGARLVLARPQGHKDGCYLVDLIVAQGITTVHFVPSMLNAWLETDVSRCSSLRRVFCSGEALQTSTQARFFQRVAAELHNLYGPTEAAVDVTAWRCRGGHAAPRVPIGRPIANTQIHILDEGLNPVPIGVSGELFIAGVGLARGYLNRPDLSAERFVHNPFSREPGARMYRTGDLARYLPDGSIDYLGRLDRQVKVRGVRVEPGEIEAALTALAGVREAAVLVRKDSTGENCLVACVAQRDPAMNADRLREACARVLPDAMVPAHIVLLDRLPLGPNGKLDRQALPDAMPLTARPADADLKPPSSLEHKLAGVWAEVLNLERVGRHENFFDLGGNSLSAMRVQSRLREVAGLAIAVIALFQHPTVASLASHLSQAQDPHVAYLAIDERAQKAKAARGKRRRPALDFDPKEKQHDV